MDTVYYFDKILIYSKRNKMEILEQLPLNQLEQLSRTFKVLNFRSYNGINSMIYMTVPSPECLQLLYKHEKAFSPYTISHIEITRDEMSGDRDEAVSVVNEKLSVINRKYSRKTLVYNSMKQGDFIKKVFDPDKFGFATGYYGGKTFQYVLYPRNSKVTAKPCVHTEFRLKGPSNIKKKTVIEKKTGISGTGELIGFKFEKFFQRNERKFIEQVSINTHSLGLQLLQWGNRKRFTDRQRWTIGLTGTFFLYRHNIGTFPELKMLQRELKSRPGTLKEMDQNFLKITNWNRFKQET
jgi:hypothetical protein